MHIHEQILTMQLFYHSKKYFANLHIRSQIFGRYTVIDLNDSNYAAALIALLIISKCHGKLKKYYKKSCRTLQRVSICIGKIINKISQTVLNCILHIYQCY